MQDISIKVDELLKADSSKIKDQEKFKKEYDELEGKHTTLRNEAEALESEIEWKIARKKL